MIIGPNYCQGVARAQGELSWVVDGEYRWPGVAGCLSVSQVRRGAGCDPTCLVDLVPRWRAREPAWPANRPGISLRSSFFSRGARCSFAAK